MDRVRNNLTRAVIRPALRTYENSVKQTARTFSVGDSVSIADVCLVTMIHRARKIRKACDYELSHPTIARILKTFEGLDAFRLHRVPPRPKEQVTSQNSDTDDVLEVGLLPPLQSP